MRFLRLAPLIVSGLCLSMASASPTVQGSASARDGQRDFDFEIGNWNTHLRRLVRPMTGSSEWVEYRGTTVVTKVFNGDANLVELDVTGPSGRIQGLSLRLYNPESKQWSLNFASKAGGTLTPPVIGEFRNGVGEFHGPDVANGRAILARFIITLITADSIRFEQSFSDNGGKTWELNWVAIDTRVKR
jgi:hypothetical protein